jgi:hypothetical protein
MWIRIGLTSVKVRSCAHTLILLGARAFVVGAGPPTMRRHALLILACPRSGATALAGALVRTGALAGREFVVSPPCEPDDNWQCAPLVALNDRLLALLGLRWDSLVSPPDRWLERPAVRALAADADALIAAQFGDATRVVMHDARLALTAPFWRERLAAADYDVTAVLMIRRPVEVAASLSRRDPVAPEKSLALWLHYLVEAEAGSRGMSRALVTYDRLLGAPASVLAHVVSDARFPLRMDRAERDAALSAIRPDFKRCGETRATGASALSSGIDAALEEGYRKLAELAPGTDPRRAVEALAQAAYASLLQAIPPWLARELGHDRASAEALAVSAREACERADLLAAELANARSLAEARAREAAALGAQIEALSRSGNQGRLDASLAGLQGDVARIAVALAEAPVREQALADELLAAHRELADERVTIARLADALEHERQGREAVAHRAAEAEARLEALLQEIAQLRAAEQDWHEHHAAQTREIEDAAAALDALEIMRDALRGDLDTTQRELERLRSELESAHADLRIVDHDRGALAARAQAVDAAATTLREQLARRAEAEAALVTERDRIARNSMAQADRITALERELARRQSEIDALSSRHEGLAGLIATLEGTWLGRRALATVRDAGR